MKDLFSPNRLAVLTGLLGALAAAAAGVLGAIDTVPKALVVSVCVIVAGAVLVVYLLGSQKDEARKFDALTPGQANTVAVAGVPDSVLPTPSPAAAGDLAVTGARSQLSADEEAEARAELARRLAGEPVDSGPLADPADTTDEDEDEPLEPSTFPSSSEHSHLGDGDAPQPGAPEVPR